MKNPERPKSEYKSTVFIISGITGINHKSEKDIIERLSNNENRVVVIHPRGTGYSEGKRGDISKKGSVTQICAGQESGRVELDFLPAFPNLPEIPDGGSDIAKTKILKYDLWS